MRIQYLSALQKHRKRLEKTSNTETSRNNIDFLSEYTIEILKCILVKTSTKKRQETTKDT